MKILTIFSLNINLLSFLLILALNLLIIPKTNSTFTPGFQRFLRRNFGPIVAKNLTRLDWGVRGSFGGGNWSFSSKSDKIPVIIVHGLGNVMGDYHGLRDEFMRRGYKDSEVYGTTYGKVKKQVDVYDTLECQFVNQIRHLILAVSAYTQSRVYVIANSLGGAISRKAILGGECVDTLEDLGPPITNRIEAYLGVAGAMKGCMFCIGIVSEFIPICSKSNGLYVNSQFIRDINNRQKYESSRILILESSGDDVIGFESLNHTRLMEIDRADHIIILNGTNHERTVFGTQALQYDYLVLNKTNQIPFVNYRNMQKHDGHTDFTF